MPDGMILALQVDEIDTSLLTQLAFNATGDLCPMQGVIGGITAQEVMKVCLARLSLITQLEYSHMCEWIFAAFFLHRKYRDTLDGIRLQ